MEVISIRTKKFGQNPLKAINMRTEHLLIKYAGWANPRWLTDKEMDNALRITTAAARLTRRINIY